MLRREMGHTKTAVNFYFDVGLLAALAERSRDTYRRAKPFPHIVIDNFLPEEPLEAVLSEFPDPGEISWIHYDTDVHDRKKLASPNETSFGPTTRHLLSQLNSATFLNFLESLTGIKGLIPDPHFFGGGLHQTQRDGFLKVHTDFNWHDRLLLDRRLNLLLYLNHEWSEEYGGNLELWDRDVSRCQERILPVFNRCVIFSTTDWSYHGHPDPLSCPEDMTRKSLALYYYSNGRPTEEAAPGHGTMYQARPGEVVRDRSATGLARKWLPPIVADTMSRFRARRAGRS